ncbi:hypothetical protein E5676_scaffold863G001460 [Cucumis melo var. makuwa]|uniref:Uncharacterized protein n=1 Tax=Cucumis melo var. makuwa TaxID=1194695 RepID=A0A5D3BVL7_CUCMM|nr:hypothetical protein E5676_scaffold863G001460 [Cucumis melo var. makuwa]
MARHGHFWSLANLPLPLPRPLPEKHNMERDILVCSEPRGSTKTIGLRGSRRITRIISISMLDWRPVGPRSPKYVVIPKDTHVELVVEISYLEICSTSPNSQKMCFPSSEVEIQVSAGYARKPIWLTKIGAKGPEQTGDSRTGGSARLETQEPVRLKGWDRLGHDVDRRGVARRGAARLRRGRGFAWAQVLHGFPDSGGLTEFAGRSGEHRDFDSWALVVLGDGLETGGFGGETRVGFRSVKATADGRRLASDPRRRRLEGAVGWLSCAALQLSTRRGGWRRKFQQHSEALVGGG